MFSVLALLVACSDEPKTEAPAEAAPAADAAKVDAPVTPNCTEADKADPNKPECKDAQTTPAVAPAADAAPAQAPAAAPAATTPAAAPAAAH